MILYFQCLIKSVIISYKITIAYINLININLILYINLNSSCKKFYFFYF